MLIQKDYIIVELNQNCGNWYAPTSGVISEHLSVEENEINGTLTKTASIYPCTPDGLWKSWGKMGSLDFIIQVNGKLKKHRTYFEIQDVQWTEETPPHIRWEWVQEAISMLSSLWYELDIFEIQQKITDELNCICGSN